VDNDKQPNQFHNNRNQSTRREFLMHISFAGVGFTIGPWMHAQPTEKTVNKLTSLPENHTLLISINGIKKKMDVDTRTTLLDLLREDISLTGTKKGCDRGQCGACTVLVNGRRINSCLTLALMCNNADVITIEGLAKGDKLHPVQEAFIKHDAFQCGYCTPGQICSAIGLLKEGHANSEEDIKELMSGNICRCGAYQNITNAIKEVKEMHEF
jgi:xanthine dehydrogenase YagT iron-sulfur-binding subunit